MATPYLLDCQLVTSSAFEVLGKEAKEVKTPQSFFMIFCYFHRPSGANRAHGGEGVIGFI